MKITIIGTGYVGLVTGACLAELGNDVFCLDVDQRKIDLLNNGGIPIHEPGLEEVVARNRAAGRLHFSTDVAASVAHGQLQFIAVGTPPDEDGSADLQYVLASRSSSTSRPYRWALPTALPPPSGKSWASAARRPTSPWYRTPNS
jgi:UDPglucose 6-dehydrogenase